MKTFKIVAISVIVSGALFIAGSTYAAFQINLKDPSKSGVVVPSKQTSGCLSVSEQIKMGFKYDICTGEKLPASFSADQVEARFQAIEARLNKLEAKR